MVLRPFHVAVPVDDLSAARHFYGDLLGCTEGRSADHWVDFNLYGHQLVCHLAELSPTGARCSNPVAGHDVPVPHYGVVLAWDDWQVLAEKLRAVGIDFVIEPTIRFQGKVGEQATMFFCDPAGNALEFKALRDDSQLFER
jgi:extradiol dioxygenase family protein